MDLNLNKEPVLQTEVIFDGQAEQGVEFDYILPDFYPDIFKILKCNLKPSVISYNISGTQLICDGIVYIKVLYVTQNSNCVQCIDQRYTYSKTIDLGKTCENATVSITPKVDYCNCRAISGRRIDVRGAVSFKIKVTGTKQAEMITDADGMGIQAKKQLVNYCGEKINASHQFISKEDIETGSSRAGAATILNHSANVSVTDYKVIANKVVVKGEAQVKAIYLIKSSDDDFENEVMEATIPISQIIDIDGVTERHSCFVNLTVMDCDLEVKSGDDGENKIFSCDLTIDCSVTAHLENSVQPLLDIYSTDYDSNFTTSTIKVESLPQILTEQLTLKDTVECSEGTLEAVYDAYCDVVNVVCRVRDGKELVFTGQANMQVLGQLDDGTPIVIEKAEPFELVSPLSELYSDYSIDSNLQVAYVNFSITSDNRVDIRVNLVFRGCLYRVYSMNIIKEISVNEAEVKEKDTDYALKLYYAEKNEEIWNIAKRYNTSADSIIAENDLESDKVGTPCMLLIPIV